MSLDPAFQSHLHALMIEVSESLSESEALYKNELIWKAQKSGNAANMPNAYKDAALHALKNRFEQTVERYFEALSAWQIEITDSVEQSMIRSINALAVGPSSLFFPPAMHAQNAAAVQSAYSQERERLTHSLQRWAANRLRDLKMKSKRPTSGSGTTFNNVFNAPVGTAYMGSSHIQTSTTSIVLSERDLAEIGAISDGNAQLEGVARDIHLAHSENAPLVDKLQRWAILLQSVDGLVAKAQQHYPAVINLLHRLQSL